MNYWMFFLIMARFFGAMLLFPLFNDTLMPKMLKAILAMIFAVMVFPRFMNIHLEGGYLVNGLLVVKEVLIGVFLGYAMGFPIWLIENIGNIIDLQRGEQFGSIVNQLTKNPASSISKLMSQAFTVYFVSIGGLLLFIKFVNTSFLVWSPENFFYTAKHYKVLIELFCHYFYWLVVMSLPVVLIMYILELVLGLLSSFVPQLNVTVLAMPIKSMLALLVLTISLGGLYHSVIIGFVNENLFNIFKI